MAELGDLSRYVTLAEAAKALGLPRDTVRRRVERRIMDGVHLAPRVWLVRRDEVERWRERGKLPVGRKPRSSRPEPPTK
ncbi:MAG TPA: helix-turn-helix domain-containing protein [Chloroflexota bacterium]|nr:helix-turn-helix domain-containing protein [Chloroflexota bacterium]